ncbi:MAG: hypothetical protein HYT79_06955 [Elusimicrobia bacterium]|nr:hypothetical protein [Elusimicrobiota bacterium]
MKRIAIAISLFSLGLGVVSADDHRESLADWQRLDLRIDQRTGSRPSPQRPLNVRLTYFHPEHSMPSTGLGGIPREEQATPEVGRLTVTQYRTAERKGLTWGLVAGGVGFTGAAAATWRWAMRGRAGDFDFRPVFAIPASALAGVAAATVLGVVTYSLVKNHHINRMTKEGVH